MLGLAPDVRIIDIRARHPPHDVRGRRAPARPGGAVPPRRLRRRGRGRPRRGHRPSPSVSRSPAACCSAPTTACSPRRWPWPAAPGGGLARRPGVPASRARPHVRGPRRAGARPPGYLAAGVDLAELGAEVDPATLVPGLVPLPRCDDDGSIVGEVWWVDRFGNCQLNVDPGELRCPRAGLGVGAQSRCASAGVRPRPVGAHLRRRQAVGAGAARRLLRAARAGARPGVGGDDCACRPAAASRSCRESTGHEAGHHDRDRHPPAPHLRRRRRAVRPEARALARTPSAPSSSE